MLAKHHEQAATGAAPNPSTFVEIEPRHLTLVEPLAPPLHVAAAAMSIAMPELGTRLRLERERRRITLASIAADTKIGVGLLKGLERNDVSHWPNGIFRRAFIRSYAEAVGLDADLITREFIDAFPDPTAVPEVRISRPGAAAGPRRAAGVALRLTLEEAVGRGEERVGLARIGQRAMGVACDMAVLMAIAAILFAVLHAFWIPLAVTMACYYGGSVVLLGNTPGSVVFVSECGAGRMLLARFRRAVGRLTYSFCTRR